MVYWMNQKEAKSFVFISALSYRLYNIINQCKDIVKKFLLQDQWSSMIKISIFPPGKQKKRVVLMSGVVFF